MTPWALDDVNSRLEFWLRNQGRQKRHAAAYIARPTASLSSRVHRARKKSAVQHITWDGSGTNLLDATEHAGAGRHILVLLGAGLITGAGQIILKRLSSGNGIDTTAASHTRPGGIVPKRTVSGVAGGYTGFISVPNAR